ncbi:MAG: C39 family peptidase [Anaerolineaceae bacterium]
MKAASNTSRILPWQWFALFILFLGLMGSLLLLVLAVVNLTSSGRRANQPIFGFSNSPSSYKLAGTNYISATPFQPQPSFTATLIPSLTPTFTSTPTKTPTATPFPTETPFPSLTPVPPPTSEPSPTSNVASAYQIGGVAGHAQLYTLDCEARSAVDWANFLGHEIDEIEFLGRLSLSDNPDYGFVGSFYGEPGQLPPYSYGVHADPVADLLQEYGVNASAIRGATWTNIQTEISANRPVIAWVINHTYPGYPVDYQDSQGRTAIVARFEHSVIVTGYNAQTVTLLDGDMVYERSIQEFLNSWAVLGNMMIIYNL